ncbi:hypothetical protein B0H14DRAFT_2645692 [Mycena olivaceomarginata]|nr:hypothetical protein B0H14DRAFT_2645692 [Mycena olivaceomarginata]
MGLQLRLGWHQTKDYRMCQSSIELPRETVWNTYGSFWVAIRPSDRGWGVQRRRAPGRQPQLSRELLFSVRDLFQGTVRNVGLRVASAWRASEKMRQEQRTRNREAQGRYREKHREWIAHKARLAVRKKNAAAGKETKARHYYSCDELPTDSEEDDDEEW